uniref:V-set pre-B cell surrogate light chain 3 n=1 Tax=Myotis lucifugus TaxID=59463 RepID=G1NTA7_MYOLU
MAWWRLALLLLGALLAAELMGGTAQSFLAVASLQPGFGRASVTEGMGVSQPVLTQPDALLVFPGQVVQISCMLNPRHANIGDYGVSWYQQRAGSAPRYLLYYRSKEDHHRSPDIPDRFSAATDAAQNAGILIISPVQPEDDADYYCSVG